MALLGPLFNLQLVFFLITGVMGQDEGGRRVSQGLWRGRDYKGGRSGRTGTRKALLEDKQVKKLAISPGSINGLQK